MSAREREFPPIIPLMPATRAHHIAAIWVSAALILVFAAIAPFSGNHLGRVGVFVPVLQTVLSAADLLTATLLLGQYSVQRSAGYWRSLRHTSLAVLSPFCRR
ncbi:hypothetical protein [Bradyrhizobium liaoningense]|uniref:hypothetical protein n=1 Tax=Bradyrhizobium liaoningense TaxID=43992 RepID=UPI001BAD16E8|nr:hypothetical protein [Bradyrhizobium liaoningense]MBR0906697.1 hypothetical protein [Bradyrhizobium liaoningense]